VSNLAQRVAVGVVAIPIVLLLCMAGGPYFFTFVALVSALALREFYGLADAKAAKPLVVPGIIGGFFVNLSFFVPHAWRRPDLLAVLIVIVVACSVWELFRNRGSAVLNLSTTLFGVLYISLFFGTLIGIRQLFVPAVFPVLRYFPAGTLGTDARVVDQIHAWGGYTVIAVFATIWICDAAAFHVGVALGKHKLFPRVSPKKSWEGAVAGFVCAILSALAAKYLVLPFLPVVGALVIGVTVGTIGQLGDLTESLMKRDAGVKDSSALIPGHGGAFDRFDSVLLVAPCVYLYLDHFFLT
jgi:phosphatidate cytidylyltransferase